MADLISQFTAAASNSAKTVFVAMNQDDVDHAAHIDMLTSELDRIKKGVDVLHHADLKHAVKCYRIGVTLYKKKQRAEQRSNKMKLLIKRKGWRQYLETAKDKAESGMFTVENAEDKLDAFYIICNGLFALHGDRTGENSEPDTVMTAIRSWIEFLLGDKSIAKALSKFKQSVTNNTVLATETEQLLSKNFKYINAAVLVCSEYEAFYDDEREEFRKVFQNCTDLREATRPECIKNWENIKVFKKPKISRDTATMTRAPILYVISQLATLSTLKTCKVKLTKMYSKKKLGDCSFDGESIDNSKRIGFDEINMIIEAKYVLWICVIVRMTNAILLDL